MYGDEFEFRYDIKDSRYRVHPDQWIPLLHAKTNTYRYEMYDIVGNFDFLPEFKYKKKIRYEVGDKSERIVTADTVTFHIPSPILIEPMISDRKPSRGYSVIGPWKGNLQLGVGRFFFVPYYTRAFTDSSGFDSLKFEDITQLCVMENETLVINTCICKDKRDCQCTGSSRVPWRDGSPVGSSQVFCRRRVRYDKQVEFRVFVQRNHAKYAFNFVPFRVLSYPYNQDGSIVYPYNVLTVAAALNIIRFKHHRFKELISLEVVNRLISNAYRPIHSEKVDEDDTAYADMVLDLLGRSDQDIEKESDDK